jgi:hypothetical protein
LNKSELLEVSKNKNRIQGTIISSSGNNISGAGFKRKITTNR